MGVDQARQERAAGQVDGPGALGRLDRIRRARPGDRAIVDQDDPAVVRLVGDAVEDPVGPEQDALGR